MDDQQIARANIKEYQQALEMRLRCGEGAEFWEWHDIESAALIQLAQLPRDIVNEEFAAVGMNADDELWWLYDD
jgi:hypothetical protein